MSDDLPPSGWRFQPDRGIRRLDDGRAILGGSPMRLIRLTEATAAAFDALSAGRPLGKGDGIRRFARRMLDAGLLHPKLDSRATGSSVDVDLGRVSVVIPVHDDPDGLTMTLGSLAVSSLRSARRIVVDDSSSDENAIRRAADEFGAEVVRLRVNAGPGAARNRGAELVDTDFIAFVDADVEVANESADDLLAHFEDPAIALVAPRITSRPGPGLIDHYERHRSPLDLGSASGPVRPLTRVAYVPSAMIIVRRDVFNEHQGFDGALRFGEDVDLIWRLVSAGERIRYVTEAEATHRPRPTIGKLLHQRYGYGTAAASLHLRHSGHVPPLAVSGWSLGAWALAATGHPAMGLIVAAGSTAALPAKLAESLSEPWRESVRLAGWGHWMAGRQIAEAMTRTWWPIALVTAAAVRRLRPALLAAAMLPALYDWWRTRPGIDPLRYLLLRLVDDGAYGAGVWVGCFRNRTFGPLIPKLESWPGRREPKPSAHAATEVPR